MEKSTISIPIRKLIKNKRDYLEAKSVLVDKLRSIDLNQNKVPGLLKAVAEDIGVHHMTVRHYLGGHVKDCYLGELIYELVTDNINKFGEEKSAIEP